MAAAVRHWSVRHARALEGIYAFAERIVIALDPLWRWIGYERVERPFAAVERVAKGFLFDCRMCGQCVLSASGLACPMNCPKQMRNGPCGGVRADGACEVDATMRCVWVEAVEGSARMRDGGRAIRVVQPPLDRRLEGRSSWLALARTAEGNAGERTAPAGYRAR
jgi:hypothetical protein